MQNLFTHMQGIVYSRFPLRKGVRKDWADERSSCEAGMPHVARCVSQWGRISLTHPVAERRAPRLRDCLCPPRRLPVAAGNANESKGVESLRLANESERSDPFDSPERCGPSTHLRRFRSEAPRAGAARPESVYACHMRAVTDGSCGSPQGSSAPNPPTVWASRAHQRGLAASRLLPRRLERASGRRCACKIWQTFFDTTPTRGAASW